MVGQVGVSPESPSESSPLEDSRSRLSGSLDWVLLVTPPVVLACVALIIVVQTLSCVQLFATPWTAACLSSQSFTISWSLFKLLSI